MVDYDFFPVTGYGPLRVVRNCLFVNVIQPEITEGMNHISSWNKSRLDGGKDRTEVRLAYERKSEEDN